MSALFSKSSNSNSSKPNSPSPKLKLAPKPTKLRVVSHYVKLNALLAIIGAVIGLWALKLVFSYLS